MNMGTFKVKSCKKCKSLFETSMEQEICPVCKDRLNKVFDKVRVYIRRNIRADVQEVSEKCDVTTKQIMDWVREERLFFTEDSNVTLPCIECGEMIRIGKYCESCKKKVHKVLKSSMISNEKSNEETISSLTGRKMRPIDHR